MAPPTSWPLARPGLQALRGLGDSTTIVDLAHPLRASTSHYPTHRGFELELGRRHGDRVRGDGSSSASCQLTMGTHTGTHLDAVGHVSQDGRLHDGSDARAASRPSGLLVGGIEETPPLLAPAVLVDLTEGPGHVLPADHEVTPAELGAALEPLGTGALEDTVLLLRTGWEQHWETPRYVETTTPGPGRDAATWIADRGVQMVGSDTATFERGPVTDAAPVHFELIVRRGVQILENLRLSELAARAGTGPGRRAVTCTVLVVPLPIEGATGSPVRPLAMMSS